MESAKRLLWVFACLFCLLPSCLPAQYEIEAQVDKNEVAFGESLNLVITITHQLGNGGMARSLTPNIGEIPGFDIALDLLRFLASSEIIGVQSTFMNDPQAHNRMPDTASISISFKNGSIGTIHYFANGNKDFPKERIEIFANGGILQIDNFKSLNSFGFAGVKNQSLWAQDKGHSSCMAAFIEAIAAGKASPIPFNEIYEVSKATLLAAGLKELEPEN